MAGVTSPQRPPRTIVVIGGTSGIGLATARLASERGDRVVVVSRSEARVHEVAVGLPGEAIGVAADVLDEPSVVAALEAARAAYGRVDAVVTSAQVMTYGTVEEVPVEVLDRVVDTAVLGLAHVARATLPVFRAQGGGTLVVVSSLLAQSAVPRMGSYSAAKWGQLALVRSMQTELRADRTLHVCAVLPGAIDTPIYEQASSYAGRAGHAPPPVIAPERVAEACLRMLDRPRRMVHAGPANRLTVMGFRHLPWLYDRLAPYLVTKVALRGAPHEPGEGNVFAPVPELEAERGGWTPWGTRTHRGRRDRRRYARRHEGPGGPGRQADGT